MRWRSAPTTPTPRCFPHLVGDPRRRGRPQPGGRLLRNTLQAPAHPHRATLHFHFDRPRTRGRHERPDRQAVSSRSRTTKELGRFQFPGVWPAIARHRMRKLESDPHSLRHSLRARVQRRPVHGVLSRQRPLGLSARRAAEGQVAAARGNGRPHRPLDRWHRRAAAVLRGAPVQPAAPRRRQGLRGGGPVGVRTTTGDSEAR